MPFYSVSQSEEEFKRNAKLAPVVRNYLKVCETKLSKVYERIGRFFYLLYTRNCIALPGDERSNAVNMLSLKSAVYR